MSRNGSGTYSVVNTFVSGNSVTASGHNQNWTDVAAEITNSVAADGQTTITAPIKFANGTAGAPSITFASDTNSGWYRIGADNVGLALNGVKVLDVATTGLAIAGFDIINGTSLTALATDDTLPVYDLSATANKRILISDVLKITNALTEDTTPDTSADFVLSYDTSASAAKKVKLQTIAALPRGYIDGGVMGNGADATNDITVTAGVCRDSTNTVNITVPAFSTGKQLDANWAAGDAAGMRNSAVGIANGTYHLYVVRTAASETGDIYAHTSATVATVLAALQLETGGGSYIYARRIGSITRIGGIITPFVQRRDYIEFTAPANDFITTPGTSGNTKALSLVPTGLALQAQVSHNGNIVYASALTQTNTAASNNLSTAGGTNGIAAGVALIWTDTSAQIRVRTSDGSTAINIICLGYFDPRGRDS